MVLWSRLHILTNSDHVLRYTLYMIMTNMVILHVPTIVLAYGCNANTLTGKALSGCIQGYSVTEKVQVSGFFTQELILPFIYIKEAVRLLRLTEIAQSITTMDEDESELNLAFDHTTL